jgi:outer membrane receptor protein involved in Fe transport
MAGYASYLFSTKKKFNFKVGARYEYTEITADDSRGAIVIPAYSNLVPSFNVSKTVKTTTFKLGYNRRIQRPGLQQLNPNVNLVNPLNISYGNASLNPELTDNLEFSLSKSIKKSYLTASLFARQSNNSITRVSFASDSIPGAIITTFENIGKEQTLGTNVFGNVILRSNWTLNGGVDVYYRYLEGFQNGLTGLSEKISNDGFIVSGRMMTNLKLQKGWAMQAGGGIRGNNVNLQGKQGGMGMYSLGFRKDFGKKASLGLAAENFFGGMVVRNSTETPVIFQKSVNYMYNSNLKATFSYKIGNMRFVAEKKKVKNDDVKSGGDDN